MTTNHHTAITLGAAADAATFNSPLSQLDSVLTDLIAGSEYFTKLRLAGATELTIATGAIAITQSFHTVDTEGDASSDNLTYITGGGEGTVLFIQAAHTDRTVVVKHGTGNIHLVDAQDYSLDNTEKVLLLFYDNKNLDWIGLGISIPVLPATGGTGLTSYTAGDLVVATASDTMAALNVGSDGQQLVADSGESEGMRWAGGPTLLGTNLIRNFPSLEAADGAQPDWWDVANDATLTEEDASGESLPEKYERVLKFTASADGGGADYLYQTFTESAEPSLDASVTKVSAGIWVYQKSTDAAGTITFDLYDTFSAASLGTDTTTTQDGWAFLRVENVTMGVGSLLFRVMHSANDAVVYATMPVFNAGDRGIPFRPRGLRHIMGAGTSLLDTDPGATAWANIDVTGTIGANGVAIDVYVELNTNATGRGEGSLRKYGSSLTQEQSRCIVTPASSRQGCTANFVQLNDSQQFQWIVNADANVDNFEIMLRGWWEWE